MTTILQDIKTTIMLAIQDEATSETTRRQLIKAKDQCTILIKHFVDDGR